MSVAGRTTDGKLDTVDLADGSVTTTKIADLAVTTAKIDNLAVTTAKIDNLAVTNAKINDLNADKITAGTLDAARIAAASIEATKLNIRQIIITSTWTDNSPDTNSIAWSSGSVYYAGTAYAITGSNTNDLFVYWIVGNTSFSTSDVEADTIGSDRFLIATNKDSEGIHDPAWNKNASAGVVRENLSFGLLEGYHIENAVVQAVNMSSGSTVTLINESTEGVLLQIGAMYASADSALQYRAKFRITVDGGSSTDYPVFFGDTVTLEFSFEAKTECTNVTAIGTLSPGDSYSHYIGVTYKTSLLVEWVPTVTGSTGQVSVKVRRALKV